MRLCHSAHQKHVHIAVCSMPFCTIFSGHARKVLMACVPMWDGCGVQYRSLRIQGPHCGALAASSMLSSCCLSDLSDLRESNRTGAAIANPGVKIVRLQTTHLLGFDCTSRDVDQGFCFLWWDVQAPVAEDFERHVQPNTGRTLQNTEFYAAIRVFVQHS